MLKKNASDKIKGTKKPFFFFSELQLIIVLLLFCGLYALKHKVRLSKTVCRIFHFLFCLVFIKVYIFIQHKPWTL